MARRPHDHHQPIAEISRRDEPGFAIVPPIIRRGGMAPGEHLGGITEIKPPLGKRGVTLGRIEGDAHGFYVTTKKSGRKERIPRR